MIGTNLNLDLPSLSDTLAVVVSKTATALDALQVSVADKATPAALNINAPLPLNGNALTEVTSVQFASGNLPSAAGSMYYNTGEFYAIDATGTIQLTSLGAINAAGFGAIVGDYGGVNPARVTYDNASSQYRFTSSSGVYADLVAKDLILESNGFAVKLGVNGALSGNYSVTLPAALPAAALPMFIDASGVITTPTTPTYPSNTNIQLQGTGYIKTGNRSFLVLLTDTNAVTITGSAAGHTGGKPGADIAVSSVNYFPIQGPLDALGELQGVAIDSTETGGTASYAVFRTEFGSDTFTAVSGTVAPALVVPPSGTYQVFSPTTAAVLRNDRSYWLGVSTGSGVTVRLRKVLVTYSTP